LFHQEFGPPGSVSWLELCLDQELAPLGDILWRSSDLPLDTILDAVADAYRRFYTVERLEQVSKRLSESERAVLADSYRILAQDRACSWVDKRPLDLSSV
jgi:hypothetical protein